MTLYNIKKLIPAFKSGLMRNSLWGLSATISQSLLMSLFYIILARKYTTADFSYFLIANTVYQFLSTISNLGLGQWFTREIAGTDNGNGITGKFLKLQLYCGTGFYLANILASFALYDNPEVRTLSLLLGINIVFDNIIYTIKCLNIARAAQNITFKVILADSVLKFVMVLLLLFFPLSITALSIGLISIRFLTLNLFLRYGLGQVLNLKTLLANKLSLSEVSQIVFKNWPFLIIGSVSVVYWRIGNIIISKTLPFFYIAAYEISFRIFSIFQILPIVVSSSFFPHLVSLHNTGEKAQFIASYRKYFYYFLFYGLFVYTFMLTFSSELVPFVFGQKYATASAYTEQMFLTILLFPTGIVQATVLISMRLERNDMMINIISLVFVIASILFGFAFVRSLAVVNISIFISFLLFHICQDLILIKKGVSTARHVMNFYCFTAAFVVIYILLARHFRPAAFFIVVWTIIGSGYLIIRMIRTGRAESPVVNINTQ